MPTLSEYSLVGKVAIMYTAGGDEAPVLAQALAEAGSDVFTIARRQELLAPVLARLAQFSGKYAGVAADVGNGSQSELKRAMEAFAASHDRVDILVNDVRSMFAHNISWSSGCTYTWRRTYRRFDR